MKSALVMAGGEIKGAWEAGALWRYCVAHPEWEPEMICGTSVGALNSLFLAASLARDPGAPFISHVEKLWRFWRYEVTTGHQLAKKRSKLALAANLALGQWNGLQSMEPLRKLVDKICEGVDPLHSRIPTHVAMADLRSGLVCYVPATVETAMASAMMPIIMPPQEWQGESVWYDGGVRELAPLKLAIDGGAEHLVVLVPSPETLPYQAKVTSLFEVAGRLLSCFINEITNNDIERCLRTTILVNQGLDPNPSHRPIDLVLCRPQQPIKFDIWHFTQEDIWTMMDQGVSDMVDTLT